MPAIIKEELDSYNPEYYQRRPIFLFKLTNGSFIRRQNHNIQKKLPIYKKISKYKIGYQSITLQVTFRI